MSSALLRTPRLARVLLPAILLLGLSASSASAHEDDGPYPPPKRTRAPTLDPSAYRSDQFAAFEFRIGPYRPNIDSEFGGEGPFNDTFGPGSSAHFGLEFDLQLLRIPYLGSLGPGIGWSFTTFSGTAPLASTGEPSKHPTSIWIMPMYLVGVLRIDVLARELDIPIVPYGKLGVTYALWDASDAGSTSVDSAGVEGKGAEYGYQFHLGGMLHLNFFAPQAALDMDNTTGVNNAYLFFEWMKSDVNSLGNGMQVGTSTWVTGLAVEY